MNWVIDKSQKMRYHTHLEVVLAPFMNDLDKYKWVLSALELNHIIGLPINL